MRKLARIARRPVLAVTVTGVFSLLVCAAVARLAGVPPPWGHDGFSYLLAGDTFARGRLANPPHPMWTHFESFHILQQPTYASKFPPAQGLALATGQVVFGHPIAGVWATTALASAAVCWMLLGWTRPRWAMLGALLFALHPILLLWSRWYAGGAVAVIGGALALGGARRREGLWLGVGISILMLSRPYEGAVWSAICLALYRRLDWRWIAPVAVAALWLGYYNWRVTGDAFRLPYIEHERQYGFAPPFVWMKPAAEPEYRHEVMREFQRGLVYANYDRQRTFTGFATASWKKLVILAEGLFPIHLLGLPMALAALALVPLRWALRDVWMRRLALGLGIFAVALLMESWMNAHYAAPAMGGLAVLGILLLRRVWIWRPWLGRVIVAGCVIAVIATVVGLRQMEPPAYSVARQGVLEELQREPGRHLVLVRYATGKHSPEAEWVYNEADIDAARVVWAREMPDNSRLLEYFSDRQIWLLEADADAPRLVPYAVQR